VERSVALMQRLSEDPATLRTRLGTREAGLGQTEGPRIRLYEGRNLHLRPSGNVPEFRV
jgi:phosphomannomutase